MLLILYRLRCKHLQIKRLENSKMYFIIFGIVAACIFIFYMERREIYQTLEKVGIAHPKPNIVLGNIRQFYKHPLKFVSKLLEEYGGVNQTAGFYIGPTPIIVTKDLEIIKDVLVRKFDNFVNRTRYPLIEVYPLNHSVLSLRDNRWRIIRSKLSPFFTKTKLKACTDLMNMSADAMSAQMHGYVNTHTEIYELSQEFMCDVLVKCILGVNHDFLNDNTHEFFTALKSFSQDMRSPALKLGYFFPSLSPVAKYLQRFSRAGKMLAIVQKYVQQAINLHKIGNLTDSCDFVSLMLKGNENVSNEELKLTDEEILGAAMTFVLVGFDTTASTIAYTLHSLSHHQEVQQKLYDEIEFIHGKNDEDLTYDDVMNETPYLDQVCNEALRMYPPFPAFSSRECKQSCELNGTVIPKGCSVLIPIHELHHDAEIWNDPCTFDPSRFAPENVSDIPSMAFQPFSDGSRNCIGKRLGTLCYKMAVTKVVKRFKLLPSDLSEKRLESGIRTSAVSYPKYGANIRVVDRDHTMYKKSLRPLGN